MLTTISYNGALVEQKNNLSQRIEADDLINSCLALFEVVAVALSGSILAQWFFSVFGLGTQQILESTLQLFVFMVSEASLTLLLIVFFLRLRGEHLSRLGWIWEKAGREVLLGVAIVPILFGCTLSVANFFRLMLPQYATETNPILELVQSHGDLVLFLISSVYVGGIKEEIQRAFVLDRFERYVGVILLKSWIGIFQPTAVADEKTSRRIGMLFGLILWTLFFALGHAIQGIDNAVGAGVLGLLFGLLYIWRRNLAAPIVSHALYDIVTLITFRSFFS